MGIFWSQSVTKYGGQKCKTFDLENKRRQFWFCCHMLSVNCQAAPYIWSKDRHPLLQIWSTDIYDVVLVSSNLERTNQNDGFKTALEYVVFGVN